MEQSDIFWGSVNWVNLYFFLFYYPFHVVALPKERTHNLFCLVGKPVGFSFFPDQRYYVVVWNLHFLVEVVALWEEEGERRQGFLQESTVLTVDFELWIEI